MSQLSAILGVESGTHFELITASATPFASPYKGFYIAVAGTATFVDMSGHSEAGVTLVAGTVMPVSLSAITSITSATIYGIR